MDTAIKFIWVAEFIVYKVPELKHTFNTTGSEYFYMDSDQTSPKFSHYNRDIQSTKANPVFQTLLPLYSKSSMLRTSGMYNDQPPNENAGQNYGHSKAFNFTVGVYAFGKDSGFWIISSVPEFPAAVPEKKIKNIDDSYTYNDGQTKFGQIIFCVTLESEYMETLDLYRDLIRKKFDDSLYVQTWRPNLNSSTGKVTNVENVCFKNGLTYKTSLDHSKWAVAKNKPWTCICDINRHITQFKRGGLVLCLKNAEVAKEFRELIEEKNRCKGGESSEEKESRRTSR
ncbi:deoxyribonuclease-2-alpha-like [Saccostrea cucullata]|uniref:deoxyribonuclease-2-alpha-like n=1 Tax=Saccostrea cuccullata TaxID=36930 RepID=UPI002ED2C800